MAQENVRNIKLQRKCATRSKRIETHLWKEIILLQHTYIHTIYTTNFTYVFDISWGQCKKRKMVLNLCRRQGVHLDTHDRWKCVHDVFSMRSFHCGYNATVFNKLLLYALPCIRYTVNFYLYRVFSFILCQLEIIILQAKCNGLSENEWQVFVFLPLPERWNTHI